MNVSATQSTTAVQSTPATATTAPAAPAGSSDSSSVSRLGSLMSQLSDLSQSDPAKAKDVLGQIATKLGQSSDPHLQKLADKFQQAAQTGDVSSLQPHHRAGGGHHHHATPSGQAASYQQTDADTLESAIAGALAG